MRLHPITKLQHEHGNIWRVQAAIRNQLDLLEHGGVADAVLLANAFYYMRKFPSVVHHPKENLVFDRLVKMGAPVQDLVKRLHAQHVELYVLEEMLIELALQLPAGRSECRNRMLLLGRQYLATQAEHMQTEEQTVFPRARRRFRSRDWKAIREQAREIEDPMFDGQATERFQYLYDYMMREVGDDELAAARAAAVPGRKPKSAPAAQARK